jgi:hypothetical protein
MRKIAPNIASKMRARRDSSVVGKRIEVDVGISDKVAEPVKDRKAVTIQAFGHNTSRCKSRPQVFLRSGARNLHQVQTRIRRHVQYYSPRGDIDLGELIGSAKRGVADTA